MEYVCTYGYQKENWTAICKGRERVMQTLIRDNQFRVLLFLIDLIDRHHPHSRTL